MNQEASEGGEMNQEASEGGTLNQKTPKMSPFPIDGNYLVFTVNRRSYGVKGTDVVSVINMPSATAIPNMPGEMRGVIDFQDNGIPLLDLRLIFGDESRVLETDTLIDNMAQRRQDHINWVNTLKDQVFNEKPITVQTDPSKCKFGLWYDKFQTDNLNLRKYMDRFDEPHKAIHHVAIEAAEMVKAGRPEDAKKLVNETESGVLVRLLQLFDGISELVQRYLMEYAIAVEIEGNRFAVAVDDINFFNTLDHIQHPLPSGISTNGEAGIVQAIGRYQEEGKEDMNDVMLLDMDRILNRTGLAN
ncbi:MAG: chemotaxis protein CheW [Magnetococcales bacterium]|nr:chemotaxis protein CheW [Magnetococcales bacterium]